MKEVSLQLYSLREEFEKDYKATMRAVANMGYTGVEFAGYGNLPKEEMKELLDECGLAAVSSHVGLEELEQNLDWHIDYLQFLGCHYLICPYSEMKIREDAVAIAERLNVLADRCAMRGMDFGYHNHGHEFAKTEDGESLFSVMMKHCNNLVLAEIDVYWVRQAGEDPVEVIRRFAGKVPLVHLKELARDSESNAFNAGFGDGEIDFPEVVRVAKMLGAEHFIVEQEFHEGTGKSRRELCLQDIEYLKNL